MILFDIDIIRQFKKLKGMTRKQQGGKIKGGQVFVFSREVKNDGQFISTGEVAKTHIETEKYSGRGSVESHQYQKEQIEWYDKWWIKYVIFPLFCGLILLTISFYLKRNMQNQIPKNWPKNKIGELDAVKNFIENRKEAFNRNKITIGNEEPVDIQCESQKFQVIKSDFEFQ